MGRKVPFPLAKLLEQLWGRLTPFSQLDLFLLRLHLLLFNSSSFSLPFSQAPACAALPSVSCWHSSSQSPAGAALPLFVVLHSFFPGLASLALLLSFLLRPFSLELASLALPLSFVFASLLF